MPLARLAVAALIFVGCTHEDPYRRVGRDPMQNLDGDELADRVDNCPTRRGGTQNSGCPEPQRVSLRAGEVALLAPVYFQSVGETLQLEAASQAMIVEAAEVLARQSWIRAVRVVSHTDSAHDDPKKLAQQRAGRRACGDASVGDARDPHGDRRGRPRAGRERGGRGRARSEQPDSHPVLERISKPRTEEFERYLVPGEARVSDFPVGK